MDEQQPPDPAEVPVPLDGVDDPAALLTFARDQRRLEMRAGRGVFLAAAKWAEMHSEDSIDQHDWVPGGDRPKPIAGAGCPMVAEFSLAEFAAVTGRSPQGGRRLIGQAVETRHRLPHVWAQVLTGKLEAWKAAQIAEATMALSPNAAAFVDAHVAPVAAKIGHAQLGRLIGEAITRFDPTRAEAEEARAADRRCFRVGTGQTGGNAFTSQPGTQATVTVEGVLGYTDARDLDLAVQHGAAQLADLGSTETLDVRRSRAVGAIARRDLTLDLSQPTPEPAAEAAQPTQPATSTGPSRSTTSRSAKARQVVIHAHLSAAAIRGARSTSTGTDTKTDGQPDCELARVEGHGWVTADQVRAWCGDPDTQVVVTPVIDLDDCISVDAYEVPRRLAQQIFVRDLTCVFPGCRRPARHAQCDHVKSYADGGPTCTCNIAPLCQPHHRLKTHTAWTYDHYGDGVYLWTSPHGHRLRRDPTGTTLLDPRCACQQPTPPPPPSPESPPEPGEP